MDETTPATIQPDSTAPNAGRVLHVLSQRPGLTGSGVSVDAMARCASAAGWSQRVIVGVPADDPHPAVGGLPAERMRQAAM